MQNLINKRFTSMTPSAAGFILMLHSRKLEITIFPTSYLEITSRLLLEIGHPTYEHGADRSTLTSVRRII